MTNSSLLSFLLNIAAAAALLIWAVRLVRTGFERAFAAQLRGWLRHSTANRVRAAATGMLTAILLQSSTAVAVLTAGFMTTGVIGVGAGLAIVLGADLGSALVAQILLTRLAFVEPLLIVIGVSIFLRSDSRRLRQSGRILIGLALIFMSLDMIRAASAPLLDSGGAQAAMAYLGRDPVTAFLIAAIFTWLVHSSVAAVLLFVTLTAQGLLPVQAAFAMVLGANLGGSLIAYVLTLSSQIEVRRMVTANLIVRGGGAAILLFVLGRTGLPADWLGATPARQVINLHLAYNLGLVALSLPLVGLAARLLTRLMPDRAAAADTPEAVTALEPGALENPRRALACATRELIRMGGLVEAMMRDIMKLYRQYDEGAAQTMAARNRSVQRMLQALKLYLAELTRGQLDEASSKRAMDLSAAAVNLEAGADAIARTMLDLARRMDTDGLSFSEEGWRELSDFHDVVLRNVQLGMEVLMTQNPALARELVEQKERVRELEQGMQHRHLSRLQQGVVNSIETSAIHLDTMRALKLINTSFALVAYPILEESGELLQTRLSAG